MKKLLNEVRSCNLCAGDLPLGPNPVVIANPEARVVIIGQAPGTRVHATGIPWNDPSGVQLRKWLDISPERFYNSKEIAIVPMGFCYPGKGKSGDLPPRSECAPKWHNLLFSSMPNLELFILIGQYAQKYYLGEQMERTLTATVKNYEAYLPRYFPTPHPSPRNRLWMKKNPWFEGQVVPRLQERFNQIID